MSETNEPMLSIVKDVPANLSEIKATLKAHTGRFDALEERLRFIFVDWGWR